MEELSQQPPKPRISAGYRPIVPAELNKGVGNSAYAYVAGAAGIGLVVGVGIAVAASYMHPNVPSSVSEALGTHTSGLNAIPAVYSSSTSLLNQVDDQKKLPTGPVLLRKVAPEPDGKPVQAEKRHHSFRLWPFKKISGKETASRRPDIQPATASAPAVALEPPASLQEADAAPVKPSSFVGVEGEATVASYDGTEGRIETYEGDNFVLDKSTVETSSIRWEDFPFNVHYRCDEMGACTLQRRGATETARMAR
jgi:hypothetical protein